MYMQSQKKKGGIFSYKKEKDPTVESNLQVLYDGFGDVKEEPIQCLQEGWAFLGSFFWDKCVVQVQV